MFLLTLILFLMWFHDCFVAMSQISDDNQNVIWDRLTYVIGMESIAGFLAAVSPLVPEAWLYDINHNIIVNS